MAPSSRCPFCSKSFKAGKRTTQSNINKHIRQMARHAEPGEHPRLGTPAFEEVRRNRGFRDVAPNEGARKQKVLEKQRRWRLKKKEKHIAARLDAGLDELDMDLDME